MCIIKSLGKWLLSKLGLVGNLATSFGRWPASEPNTHFYAAPEDIDKSFSQSCFYPWSI